jgi:hypothetical protein
MHTPIQFPAVLFELNASVAEVVVPASLLACWSSAIPAVCPRALGGKQATMSERDRKNLMDFTF